MKLKLELSTWFAEIVDRQHALTLLRKIKRKTKESVQIFAERLLTRSEDAFDRDGAGALEATAEQHLVVCFIDGLSDYHLKAKILWENLAIFRGAVLRATNEQNITQRIQLRLGKPIQEKEEEEEKKMYSQGIGGNELLKKNQWKWDTCALFDRCFGCGGPHKARDCRKN